jgi:hypothetical protein
MVDIGAKIIAAIDAARNDAILDMFPPLPFLCRPEGRGGSHHV